MAQAENSQSERTTALQNELLVLRTTQTKFEMEALAVLDFQSPESPLLKYLLERTQEEYMTINGNTKPSGHAICYERASYR